MRLRNLFLLAGFSAGLLQLHAEPVPLIQTHSHNDYEQKRPLSDALDHGFCSVEADIYLVDGKLLVAHDRNKLKPDRTLESLYLDPLRERVKKNRGHVYPNGPEFTLLIDLKTSWTNTWPVLRGVLEKYSDVLTVFRDNKKETNAITVILSGNRAKEMFAGENVRLASYDGKFPDLDSAASPDLIPWISAEWPAYFAWEGVGPLPDNEKQRLEKMVSEAHQYGRKLRFWGGPDNQEFWKMLLENNVDLINTDNLAGLEKFFREYKTVSPQKIFKLSRADYEDRVEAAWTAQIIACLMGFQFEHKVASTEWVDKYPKKIDSAPVDDDWYYEMCAIRGFENYGIEMTVEQLGEQWKKNSCGSWGSSEQARLLLERGIKAPDTGHPRYNKLWFTIGPQFSAEVYGLLAPGMPNLAGKLAREFGHINGYAEGTDGAIFMAAMVSLAFVERDTHLIVKKAAQMIHPDSPYRQCLDMLIAMAEAGKSAQEIADAIEDRWHIEYPATNNAVPNGGLAALGVWFGEGNFLKTLNIVYRAADFTDADCNAANAAAVVATMHGMKCLPKHLVAPLNDRIVDAELGRVKLTPPVDEKISDLAKRTVVIGEKLLLNNGAKIRGENILVPKQQPITQPAELFALADLMRYWNHDWKLERAGFGGADGGLGNIRGITHLEDDVLATWPRDTVRGVVLRRDMKLSNNPSLTFQAGTDAGRSWELEVYAGNKRVIKRLIDGGSTQIGDRKWQSVAIDLEEFAGKEIQLRLYQRVLLPDKIPGNAYWKEIEIK